MDIKLENKSNSRWQHKKDKTTFLMRRRRESLPSWAVCVMRKDLRGNVLNFQWTSKPVVKVWLQIYIDLVW